MNDGTAETGDERSNLSVDRIYPVLVIWTFGASHVIFPKKGSSA